MHAIYERYPMMRPHVGANYRPGGPQSLLLVGESHYLPPGATQHQSAEIWYSGDASTLNPQEQGWINTAEIITGSSAEGFRNRAHSIYRLSFQEINRSGPGYPDYRGVGDIVVYYNYFLRPAQTGVSLRADGTDRRIAEEVFRAVCDEYRPGAVAFLSRLAFRSWHATATRPLTVPIVAVPHSGCAHWNRRNPSYGGKSGREVLGDFVSGVWHPGKPSVAPR